MKKNSNAFELTDSWIKAVESNGRRQEYYDTKATGLILRVTKTGHKSFAFRYWYDDQSKQITIGKYGDVTLTEARHQVRGAKGIKGYKEMLREGKDPLLIRQIARETRPVKLAEYIERFKKDYLVRKLKSSTQKTYSSRLNKIKSSSIGRLPLVELTRGHIRKFLKNELSEHPINANRLHSILSKVLNEAVEDGLLKENPIKGMKKLAEENKRDPNYSVENIRIIWDAINQEYASIQGLLKMLLLTGQRLGETSRMKWSDINEDEWIIPIAEQKTGKKTNKNHIVPLTAMAVNVIEEMRPYNSEYIFPSLRDNGKPVKHFNEVTMRIRERTGLNEFRIHDLRHIVATEMIELNVPFITVGRVLNHKALAGENAITARYINSDLTEQKKIAMLKWHNHLESLIAGRSAKILEMK